MIRTTMILAVSAAPAAAEGLRVVTDIAPVQALVAGVTLDDADVAALLPPGASPHDFSMRPSDAAGLSSADAVIWVGEALTPWLSRPIETLADSAQITTLMDVPGWEPREVANDEKDHDDHDDHGDHDDHEDHADHDDHEGHDDHDDYAGEDAHEDHDDHDEHAHAHDHGPIDPHAWLDPVAAGAWSVAIGEALADADPESAATYRSNAAAQAEALASLTETIAGQLSDVGPYILPHDAYGYFEDRFGLERAGFVSDTDDQGLGPAHLAELREKVVSGEVACVFYEVGPEPGWVNTLTEGTDVKVMTIDPLGVDVADGPDFYATLLRNMADSFASCTDAS